MSEKLGKYDQFLQQYAPTLYARRARARYEGMRYDLATAQTYKALQRNRPDRPTGNSIPVREQDKVSSSDRKRGIAITRDLRGDNGIFAGLVNTFGVNCVGANGSRPSPVSSDPEFNKRADDFFTTWAEDKYAVDERGYFNFWQYQFNLLTTVIAEGDMFSLMRQDSGMLRGIEPDRVDTPYKFMQLENQSICQGVQYDPNTERPQRYWIGAVDRYGNIAMDDKAWGSVPWYGCHHSYVINRFSQFRGLTPALPSLDAIQSLDEIITSALMSWKTQQAFSVALMPEPSLPTGGTLAPRTGPPVPGATADPNASGAGSDTPRLDLATGGEIIDLRKYGAGDFKVIEANAVGAQFEQFTRLVSRIIGLPFGLPFDLVLLDVHQGNYSSQRLAFRLGYKAFLHWFGIVSDFSQRVYNWKIQDAVNSGKLEVTDKAKYDYLACRWTPPLPEMLDPEKEIQAMLLSETAGYSNKEDNCRQMGVEYRDNLAKIEQINAEYDAKKILMPWMPIPGVMSTQGIWAAINQQNANAEKARSANNAKL